MIQDITTSLSVGVFGNGTTGQQTLNDAGINAKIYSFSTLERAFTAILNGEIAICACALAATPTTLPTGLVITALSERQDSKMSLVSSQNTEGFIFDETNPAKIGVDSDIHRAQIRYLKPNWLVEGANMTATERLTALQTGTIDAAVFNQNEIKTLPLGTEIWQIQPFSVREFTPAAGQGVTCFITHEEDVATRRLLKSVHHPSVSAVTNIERTVQKMLADYSVNAYCERDKMGNYHLWAATVVNGELRKTRVSQSTSFGMAEKAVEQLLSA